LQKEHCFLNVFFSSALLWRLQEEQVHVLFVVGLLAGRSVNFFAIGRYFICLPL
jgi:hypothetical protein